MKSQFQFAELAKYRKQHKNNQQAGSLITRLPAFFYACKCHFSRGVQMKSHKYWSIGALVSMIGTCYTGYKDMKSAHKYFAFSSLICMAMAIYSGHKMISGKSRKKKETAAEESAE